MGWILRKIGRECLTNRKALKVHLQNTQGVESHFYCILRCLRLIRNISNKFAMIFNENEFNPWPKKSVLCFLARQSHPWVFIGLKTHLYRVIKKCPKFLKAVISDLYQNIMKIKISFYSVMFWVICQIIGAQLTWKDGIFSSSMSKLKKLLRKFF